MQLAGRYVALNGPEDVASSEAYRRCQEALDPNISYLVDPCRHLLPKEPGGIVTTVVETGKKSLPTLLVLAGIAELWFFGGGREAASEGAREWGLFYDPDDRCDLAEDELSTPCKGAFTRGLYKGPLQGV